VPKLCDVNLLLALVTDRHAHHPGAVRWFDILAVSDAVVCRIVQMGLLRLLNNPAVMQEETAVLLKGILMSSYRPIHH
jgi:predicted nucleic acid-binding protein